VETGSAPAGRFARHKESNDAVYQRARRYNRLLMDSALVEGRLRDVERCFAYTGRPAPAGLREQLDEAEHALNATHAAYGDAFRAGEDAEGAAFDAQADELQRKLAALRQAVAEAAQAVRPEAVELPGRLGRQARDVQALEAEGRMNRLLFGCWSPTAWSEFEQPFELEFHSSAPGSPRVHTEDEIDLGNITEACDRLQELGYAGTFGYLMFGIHDTMYAPQWLLDAHRDEPDFFHVSWDGLKGRSSGSRHSLNYFHPAVRAFIREYLRQYAEFCRDEPRVLFHETSQEAYMDFSTEQGRRESGYGPHALSHFRSYLQRKYETIAALNEAWGAGYASLEEIEPPPDPHVEPRPEVTPLVAEFEAFRDEGYIGYLKLIYDSLKAGDPDKPVVARHSSLLSGINGARIFETCDVLCYHNRAPRMQLLNVYLSSLNRFHHKGLGYMEDFWGVQEERDRVEDERAQRRGLEKHIARQCIWGRTLQMKWYAYTSGSYIFTYNGNWFDPRYDVTTMRYCAPALAVAKRKMERLDWVLTHSEIAPSKTAVLQPSATMRNERPDTEAYATIQTLHELLYPNGILYELVPEEYFEDGRAQLSDFGVVILPRARYLSQRLQDMLAAHTLGGGMLVAVGAPGTEDELGRPSGRLIEALRAEAAGWAPVEQVWAAAEGALPAVVTRCGEGRVVACQGALGGVHAAATEQLLGMIVEAAPRAAWAEGKAFEVVLRVAEDGGRYLFLLNPSVDEARTDTVRVEDGCKRAVDVAIEGGFPVTVQAVEGGAALDVRLGPGECAVLHLEQ
jgi:hypothetical protein